MWHTTRGQHRRKSPSESTAVVLPACFGGFASCFLEVRVLGPLGSISLLLLSLWPPLIADFLAIRLFLVPATCCLRLGAFRLNGMHSLWYLPAPGWNTFIKAFDYRIWMVFRVRRLEPNTSFDTQSLRLVQANAPSITTFGEVKA